MNRDQFETLMLAELEKMWAPFTANLPIKYDVAAALNGLKHYKELHVQDFIRSEILINSKIQFAITSEKEDGMNSPGILWDRLTILNCKLFFASTESPHFDVKLHNKNADVRSELTSVLNALHKAKLPRHILLAKEATERQTTAPDIGIALWQLQSSNLAMWINQDLLYTVSVDDVDSTRLRDYIRFFSEANKIRNTAIEHIDLYYAQKTANV